VTSSLRFKSAMTAAVAVAAVCAGGGITQAQFKQTDLVSDINGLAPVTDPNLVNPWGVSNLPGSPFGSRTSSRAHQLSTR
jgi:hypothetical protein